jgi:DNA polymerase-3 subunit delta'
MRLARGVIITPNPQKIVEELQKLKTNQELTIINSEKRDFLMEHASLAIEKAYVSSEIVNFIVLVAPRFSKVAQNRLLKILEEPPPNKEFILVTKSKASLLPTIKSRLPIVTIKSEEEIFELELDIENLTLATVYQFIQQNSKISNLECKKTG